MKKRFLFTVESAYHVKRFTTGWKISLKYVQESQMMERRYGSGWDNSQKTPMLRETAHWQNDGTSVSMKKAVFWDVAPCRHGVNRCFGGTHRLNLQGRRKNKESASEETVRTSASRLVQIEHVFCAPKPWTNACIIIYTFTGRTRVQNFRLLTAELRVQFLVT
jgi:hypothetical protein